MARLRLTIGGAIPVDPIRPPVVMGGSFAVSATASATNGFGRAALAIGGSITAYAAQALLGTLTVSAGARLLANLSGAFAVSGTASGAAAPTTWPNGYLYRRRITLGAQADLAAETVTDFPWFLDSTEIPGDWSWLVTAAGKLLSVVGSTPRDLRFETEAGVKLDHAIEKFDGTAGTLRAFVRVPSWDCASADFRILVYYGKAADTDQQNKAGTFQGAMMAVDTSTGTDMTGRGHTFTLTGISAATLDGRPAGAFTANVSTSFERRTNPDLTFLDGLTEATEEFWANPDATNSGNISRIGGSPGSQQANARFSVWCVTTGAVSGSSKVLEYGANWWDGTSQPNQSTESVANIADGTLRHYMIVYRSGVNAAGYDGETNFDSTTIVGAAKPGTIHPRTDDNWSFGAGTGAQTLSPPMTMGLYLAWPFAFSATRRALSDRCQRDGSLVACLGDVDLVGDTNHAPTGVTFRQAITAQTSVNLQGHAYDPDAGATITATAVTPSSDASATYAIVGGQLRVTPIAGVTGVGRPVVTISDGAKTSKVSPRLAITGSVVSSPEGLAPAFPASADIIGPVAVGALQAAYNGLSAAQIAAGVTILVTPGGTLATGLTLAKSGTAGRPIVIRAGTLVGGVITDPGSFPAATVGAVTFSGDYNWLRGFSVNGFSFAAGATGNRLNRCKSRNQSSDTGVGNSLDWCEWSNMAGVFHQCRPTQGCRTPFVYRCWMHTDVGTVAGNRVFLQFGFDNSSTAISLAGIVRDCLFSDNVGGASGVQQAVEMKCSDNVVERCAAVSGLNSLRFNVRHGQRNTFKACWADRGQIQGRGPGHLTADCVITGADFIGPASGNCTYTQWLAFAASGAQAGKYPSADGWRVVRCDNVGIGDSDAGQGTPGFPTPPAGTQLWNITGSATLLNGSSVTAGNSHAGSPPDVPPRTDPGAIKWAASQVGPNGTYSASE